MSGAPQPRWCRYCGRTMQWRRRWAQNWDSLRWCSTACRQHGLKPVDQALEHAIHELLNRRRGGATICPSEAARAVAGDDPKHWRPLMEPARCAARRLVHQGLVAITQKGRAVDPDHAKGPIRVRLRALPW